METVSEHIIITVIYSLTFFMSKIACARFSIKNSYSQIPKGHPMVITFFEICSDINKCKLK